MNKACGVKLAWKLLAGSKGLWVEVLQNKYMFRSEESFLNIKIQDSQLWKFICQQKDVIQEGTRWQIRNGQQVSFLRMFGFFLIRKFKILFSDL